MGALAQCLIASRYAVSRAGNILMSACACVLLRPWNQEASDRHDPAWPARSHAGFNNKPATEAIPLFAPVVSPLIQGLSPLLSGYATSPLRGGVEALSTQLRGQLPPLVRDVLPLLDQLEPLTMDVAAGRCAQRTAASIGPFAQRSPAAAPRSEFTPAPAETARLVRTYYTVARTLLIRFRDDTIDETPALAAVLTESAGAAALGGSCELTVTALPGDHVRPLQQVVPPPPTEVLDVAQQSAAALDQLSSLAGSFGAPTFALDALRAGVRAGVDTLGAAAPTAAAGAVADIGLLVDDITAWMALRVSAAGGAEPPPPAAGAAPVVT